MPGFVERLQQRADNMGRMIRRLGVLDEWASATDRGLRIARTTRRCMFCPNTDRCAAWLAAPDADPAAYRSFCPNAEALDRLVH